MLACAIIKTPQHYLHSQLIAQYMAIQQTTPYQAAAYWVKSSSFLLLLRSKLLCCEVDKSPPHSWAAVARTYELTFCLQTIGGLSAYGLPIYITSHGAWQYSRAIIGVITKHHSSFSLPAADVSSDVIFNSYILRILHYLERTKMPTTILPPSLTGKRCNRQA